MSLVKHVCWLTCSRKDLHKAKLNLLKKYCIFTQVFLKNMSKCASTERYAMKQNRSNANRSKANTMIFFVLISYALFAIPLVWNLCVYTLCVFVQFSIVHCVHKTFFITLPLSYMWELFILLLCYTCTSLLTFHTILLFGNGDFNTHW